MWYNKVKQFESREYTLNCSKLYIPAVSGLPLSSCFFSFTDLGWGGRQKSVLDFMKNGTSRKHRCIIFLAGENNHCVINSSRQERRANSRHVLGW